MVETLLEFPNVDPNARNCTQETPLHAAVQYDNEPIVSILLDWGVEVDSRDMYGRTPLWYARNWRYTRIAELLMEYNADIIMALRQCKCL